MVVFNSSCDYSRGVATQPRFVVLEDHPLVRDALADTLVTRLSDSVIVYSGADVVLARRTIESTGADCILLDLDLADGNEPVANVQALADLNVPILIVSALGDRGTINASLLSGANGFISKKAEPEEFVDAVRATLRGENYMSSDVAAAILADDSSRVQLSDQERRAMVLYASGLKMDAVARRMGVSVGTAQEYIKRVRAKYAKAGSPASTKTELYKRAKDAGFLP